MHFTNEGEYTTDTKCTPLLSFAISSMNRYTGIHFAPTIKVVPRRLDPTIGHSPIEGGVVSVRVVGGLSSCHFLPSTYRVPLIRSLAERHRNKEGLDRPIRVLHSELSHSAIVVETDFNIFVNVKFVNVNNFS